MNRLYGARYVEAVRAQQLIETDTYVPPCFLVRRTTLTNVAEQLQKQYNNERSRTASGDNRGPLEIINDPSILAHTKLGKKIRKQRSYIVTLLI